MPLTALTDDHPMAPGESVDQLQYMTGRTLTTLETLPANRTERHWQEDSILYIDTSLSAFYYQDILHEALTGKAIVLLDNTRLPSTSHSALSHKTMELIGLNVDSPFVILTLQTEHPTVVLARTLEEGAKYLKDLTTPGSAPEKTAGNSDTPYFPGKRLNIKLSRQDISCSYDSNSKTNRKDFCGGNASIDLIVNVTMMRSVEAPNTEATGNTPDAKFVRFSVSEDNGTGSGIHLRDQLIQEDTWRLSNIDRHIRFGPYAQSYSFAIEPRNSGKTVSKIQFSQPGSEKSHCHTEEYSSLTLGINGMVTEVNGEGPKVPGKAAGTTGIVDRRKLSWNTQEYEISNKSTADKLNIIWERATDDCQDFVGGQCRTSRPVTYPGPVFDKTMFSPMAYDQFVPNLDVVYQAAPQASGKTTFHIATGFVARVRYARVTPNPYFGVFEESGSDTVSQQEGLDITVDWDHPLFEPEANVKLRALNAFDLCLQGRHGAVRGVRCNNADLGQLWGFDSKERYRSRGKRNQCLEVKEDGSLRVAGCNDNPNQKWYWEKIQLISRFSNSDERWFLVCDDQSQIKVVPESRLDCDVSSSWYNELTNIP